MQKLKYITDYLEDNAINMPSKPALLFEDKKYTWSELLDAVKLAAKNINELIGLISEQKIVGLLMSNSYEFIIYYLGIIHSGHIAMPLDPNFKELEIQKVIDQMKPTFVMTNSDYIDKFKKSDCVYDVANLKKESNKDNDFLRISPEVQIASMLFTSGTTGNPKAVPYTHANHMWNPAVVSELWNWTAKDTILLSLPLSHWHGLVMGLDGALYHGNTIYLQRWFNAEDTLQALQDEPISMFMHVPIAYSRLVEYAEQQNAKYDISKVRLCISGSSYLPPSLWKNFKKYFNQEILERYGANEMGLLTSNILSSRQSGCVGKPLDGVEIKIQEDGEIAMKSPGLFPGYYKNDEATKKQRLDDGFWLSGDIGEFDETGNLHLKGRVQEKMKKFGYTVYPRDVEWALEQHPKVKESAVLSIQQPDSLSDQFVFFVVGDITDSEINEFAKKEMPNFWRPDKIVHLDAIPRTGRTSKPAIAELKKMLG